MYIERAFGRGKDVENKPETDNAELRNIARAVSELFVQTNLHESSLASEGELKPKKDAWLMFDLDGTLLEDGLENTTKKTVEEYIGEHVDDVARFTQLIQKLSSEGFKIGINTGRGHRYAKRVIAGMFPDNSVELIVSEMGAVTERDGEVVKATGEGAAAQEKIAALKPQIENDFLARGWSLVEKQAIVSVVPLDKKVTPAHVDEVAAYIETMGLREYVHLIPSSWAIDIVPIGITKAEAMQRAIGSSEEAAIIYSGDSKGDLAAMQKSDVVVIPENARNAIENEIMGLTNSIGTDQATNANATILGLSARGKEVHGINNALHVIAQTVEFLKNQDIQRS